MQKTLRINLLTRNHAVKRARKNKAEKIYDEWKVYKQQDVGQEKISRNYAKEERIHRREDWTLGPLAPNRNAGKAKGILGTIKYDMTINPELPAAMRQSPKEPGYSILSSAEDDSNHPLFEGRTMVGNVVVGDRVVVVQGPERIRGAIGFVSAIDESKEELKINNVNVVDVEKPSIMTAEPTEDDPEPQRFLSQEGWIPMRSVRLIVRDEVSGKEYVVSQVHAGAPYVQRKFAHNLPAHTRYITGSEKWSKRGRHIQIPWPEEQMVEEFRDTLGDSARSEVEESTWIPSMYVSPLGYHIDHENMKTSNPESLYLAGYAQDTPKSNALQSFGLAGFSTRGKAEERQHRIAKGIMDELRNSRSRMATSHDNIDWVNRKMLEDARSIWWQERNLLPPSEKKAQLDIKQAQDARTALIATVSQERAAQEVTTSLQALGRRVQSLEENTQKALEQVKNLQTDETPQYMQETRDKKFTSITKSVLASKEDIEALAERMSVIVQHKKATQAKSAKVVLSRETEDLIQSIQQTTIHSRYRQPDRKMRKKFGNPNLVLS